MNFYHLRHYVKSVVMIHSTIHIKGSVPFDEAIKTVSK